MHGVTRNGNKNMYYCTCTGYKLTILSKLTNFDPHFPFYNSFGRVNGTGTVSTLNRVMSAKLYNVYFSGDQRFTFKYYIFLALIVL